MQRIVSLLALFGLMSGLMIAPAAQAQAAATIWGVTPKPVPARDQCDGRIGWRAAICRGDEGGQDSAYSVQALWLYASGSWQ